MNIHLNYCLNNVVNSLNENIFRSLSEKEQKVAVVAALIFGCIAICYVVRRYCFKVEPLHQENKDQQHKEIAKKVDEVVKNDIQERDSLEGTRDVETKEDAREPETIEADVIEELFEIEDENAELKIKKPIEQEKIPVDEPPVLLSFGKVRKGMDEAETPSLMGTDLKETEHEKLSSLVFGFCFHTTETQHQILNFLRKIFIMKDPSSKELGFGRLWDNLLWLHQALPGESRAKEIKIYWNEQAEKLLLHFCEHENVKINDLLFAIVPGEECQSSFQHAVMNFEFQLQFVGFEKKKLMDAMKKEFERLSQSLVDEEFKEDMHRMVEEGLETFIDFKDKNLSIISDAMIYTILNEMRLSLLEVETSIIEAKAKGLPEMSLKERAHMCAEKLKSKLFEFFGKKFIL